MTRRAYAILMLAMVLVAAVPTMAFGEDDEIAAAESLSPGLMPDVARSRVICTDDACRVADDTDPAVPAAIGAESSAAPVSAMDGVDVRLLVCLEGEGECSIVDGSASIEELVASAGGRLVHGAVDADPSGNWRATNLAARVKCKISGAGTSSIKVKRSRARADIERQADGRLVAQSRREGEQPFALLPMGPGLYGSVQPFSDGKVTGTVVSYYGMQSADRIIGTSLMTSTLRDGRARTDCTMKRNFDMKRVADPSTAESSSVPDDGTEIGEAETGE